ncbi:hypothetical protein PRIPAC_75026 [Pristionchus pacificus]|uniref:Uncharacterized protein n=1 Tax=Pristionchus pacificus TaxID=54126 RepID=A0A454XMU9_PRIPA|nr:hypothetical protein PRIPAC_75026 [Pristionchus pacificus]|eukprot:PDM74474.1 hypothetical protein PRIPAC_41830 [Pristionchus pacificus]
MLYRVNICCLFALLALVAAGPTVVLDQKIMELMKSNPKREAITDFTSEQHQPQTGGINEKPSGGHEQ